MSRHDWTPTPGGLEEAIASSRMSAELSQYVDGMGGWSTAARRDVALAELLAAARGGVSVLSRGADLAGVRDSTSAFNEAATAAGANGVILVPPGAYKMAGTVTPLAGQTWIMAGARFTQTGATLTMFDCNAVDDWSLIGPFSITGPGIATGTACGIKVTDGHRWRIVYPRFRDLAGYGLLVQHSAGPGTYRGETGQIIGPQARQCDTGLAFSSGSGAEYCTVTAPAIVGCNLGFLEVAGNTVVLGGSIVDNVIGVEVTGGSNHGHGMFVGTNINHNTTYNIYASQVTNGHDFTGCHVYDGVGISIYLDRCKGVVFAGGHLTGELKCDTGSGSGFNYIRGVYCPTAASITRTGTGQAELIFRDCFGPGSYISGVTISEPGSVYVLEERIPAATQSLTSATATTLLFPTENFDRRACFATGVFTVPAEQNGLYRITGTLFFTGTGMDVDDSYVDVRVDGAALYSAFPSIFQTTALVVHLHVELYLNAAQTVDFRGFITGTSPVFGHGVYKSFVAIQRIDA